jgi:hypothetical protein
MKVLVYCTQSGLLSWLWSLGADLTKFDHKIGASSWQDAFKKLAQLPHKEIKEIHFWQHGTIAAPLINGQKLPSLQQLKNALTGLTPQSLVWFRGCSIFASAEGHDFAIEATEVLGCEVASFIRVISAPWPIFQSGCYSLKPGQKPWWTKERQVKVKNNGKIVVLGSTPFVANTVFTTNMKLPEKCRKP